MKKLAMFGFALVLLGAGCSDEKIPATPSAQEPAAVEANVYTMEQVKAHANADSCWTVVRGKVYDVTKFTNLHPGGTNAILDLCGKDGTASFTKKHEGQPKPEMELSGLEIGTLKQ